MGATYKAVTWTPHKTIYDRWMLLGVVLYLGSFVGIGLALKPDTTIETQLIRALGTGAFLLLHVILSIGPLARLDSRFLPLLYNRRHLGVTMFVLALGHGAFSIFQFHVGGTRNPFVSVLTSNGRYDSLAQFPFQPLGLAALLILFLMAATSHDFWLHQLSAPVWKSLHMAVYIAYPLLVLHVGLGVLQLERNPVLAVSLGLGIVWLVALHVVAGLVSKSGDEAPAGQPEDDGFITVCHASDIEENRAKIVSLSGERVAIFRYDGKVSAVSNVCQHQNGPLGEGRIVDGCITCPWHGYQYRPNDGASPPPFTEKIPTFRVRVDQAGNVLVHPIRHCRQEQRSSQRSSPPPERY